MLSMNFGKSQSKKRLTLKIIVNSHSTGCKGQKSQFPKSKLRKKIQIIFGVISKVPVNPPSLVD